MSRTLARGEYCRNQAAQCAAAATNTCLVEAREAYLNLEQGWLLLAADFEGGPAPAFEQDSGQPRRERAWA
jgi:hypothetical protein